MPTGDLSIPGRRGGLPTRKNTQYTPYALFLYRAGGSLRVRRAMEGRMGEAKTEQP